MNRIHETHFTYTWCYTLENVSLDAIFVSRYFRASTVRRKRKPLRDTVQPEAMVNRASSPSHSSRMKNDGGPVLARVAGNNGREKGGAHLRKYCGNSSDRNGGRKAWSTVDFSFRVTRNSLVTVALFFTRGTHAIVSFSFFSGEHASTVDRARLTKVIRVKRSWLVFYFLFR